MKTDDEFFPEFYDMEEVVDQKIKPMLQTIINICSEYNIPMVASFQYKNEEDQVMLCSSAVLPEPRTCVKIKSAAQLLTR